MRALSVRQPWAELMLRGVKTIEFRSRPTRVVGERFYLYAARGPAAGRAAARRAAAADPVAAALALWADARAVTDRPPGSRPPPWLADLAGGLARGTLPTGVLVGSAVISHCTGPVPPIARGRPAGGGRPGPAVPPAAGPGDPADGDDDGGGDGDGDDGDGRGGDSLAGLYRWHLTDVRRLRPPLKPAGHPQPVWFAPFLAA